MAEIRNLTRNGETFYPLTHEKAVIGMEEFKDTITTQIESYRPIEITGNVTNAPDEEDITSDSNNLLKFKNRNNLYGLGYIILRRDSSFVSQLIQTNTIYVIQYNFDLDSGRVNIPNGSILMFEGGTLSNGTLVCADLYDVRLVYYQDISEIFDNVTLEGNFIHKACDKQSSVDNISITLDSNEAISVKDGGITGNKLSSGIVNNDDLSLINNKIQLSNRDTNSGMGYIILRKNFPFASQLTQTNTIYVIRYDFVLDSDITVPANCVLEFDGGSISSSGSNTITFNNTTLDGSIKTNNIVFNGTISNKTIYISWTGGSISKILGIDPTDHVIAFDIDTIADATINYSNKNNIVFDGCNKEINVGANAVLFALEGEYSNIEVKNFKFKGTTTSHFYSPSSSWNVIHDNIHIHHNNIDGCSLGISLNSDLAGETINSSIHDNVVKVTYPGQDIGCYGIHTANANYCTIYNNYITGANRHSMYISWGHDIDISNNFFYRCGLSGERVRGILFITRKSQNINITNNIFKECGNVHLMILHGENDNNRRTAGDLINVNVVGNTFENLFEVGYNSCVYHILIGYRVEPNNDYIEKNINITGNIIKHLPGSICVGIHSGENVLVDNNIIVHDNTYEDLSGYNNNMVIEIASRDNNNYIKSATIINNTFDLCYGSAYCFYVEHLNTHFDELTIKNNIYLNQAVYHKNRNLSLEQFPNAIDLIPTKGISSARPSLGIYNQGWRYYDITLGKPIYWTGDTSGGKSGWVNATGADEPNPA